MLGSFGSGGGLNLLVTSVISATFKYYIFFCIQNYNAQLSKFHVLLQSHLMSYLMHIFKDSKFNLTLLKSEDTFEKHPTQTNSIFKTILVIYADKK